MLNVSGHMVSRLIELAREFHAGDTVLAAEELTGWDDDKGLGRDVDNHPGNPFLREFQSVVDELDPEQQQDLVALMWLGRGDYSEDEFEEARALARDEWRPGTGEYLLAHPLLAEHLREALDVFGLEPEGLSQ